MLEAVIVVKHIFLLERLGRIQYDQLFSLNILFLLPSGALFSIFFLSLSLSQLFPNIFLPLLCNFSSPVSVGP